MNYPRDKDARESIYFCIGIFLFIAVSMAAAISTRLDCDTARAALRYSVGSMVIAKASGQRGQIVGTTCYGSRTAQYDVRFAAGAPWITFHDFEVE